MSIGLNPLTLKRNLKKALLGLGVVIGLSSVGALINSNQPVNASSDIPSIARPIKMTPTNKHKIINKIYKHGKYYYVSNANNLRFQSQYKTDACEVASIKNVLSIHHKGNNVSLYQLCNKIGWARNGHGNWNREYTGNPFTGHGSTISPWLEAKILRTYGVKAHVHNFNSRSNIINDLRNGDQLIVEAGHYCNTMRISNPHKPTDHILSIIGIKRNPETGLSVQYADSEEASKSKGVRWCSFNHFWKSYNRPSITGDRMVVAGY